MKKEDKKLDDHHCSVIERDRIKVEMANCDEKYTSEKDRSKCQSKVKDISKKREQACKYS